MEIAKKMKSCSNENEVESYFMQIKFEFTRRRSCILDTLCFSNRLLCSLLHRQLGKAIKVLLKRFQLDKSSLLLTLYLAAHGDDKTESLFIHP